VLGAEKLHGIGDDARREFEAISERYGFGLRPDVLVERLGVADRQRLEILKVLYRGAHVIILDEPTAVLVPQEVDALFENLRDLRKHGASVLFISHKLDEVLAIADDITVMRRGTTVGEAEPGKTTKRQLAELMVGSELPSPEATERTVTEVVQLSLDGVTLTDEFGRNLLTDISFDIHQGEVLGIAGVEGNGQAELVETVMGMRDASAGTIRLGEVDVTQWDTRHLREAGIAYIPEDRQRHGLLLDSPLWENRILGHQTRAPSARGPWIDRGGAREDTERIVREYDVRTPGIDTLARALSGGNQQKLVVGREMSGNPVVLIASHPTRGVDIGAQAAIWEHIKRARHDGLAVLLISADLDELIGLSDRIEVILRGRLVGTFDPSQVTPQDLGAAMTGGGGDE
jgi:general nucleoside transport system ATP-binding protein